MREAKERHQRDKVDQATENRPAIPPPPITGILAATVSPLKNPITTRSNNVEHDEHHR